MKVKNNHKAPCCGVMPGEVKELPEWLAKHMVEVLKLGEYVLPPAPKPEPKEEPKPEAPKRRRGRPRKVELED